MTKKKTPETATPKRKKDADPAFRPFGALAAMRDAMKVAESEPAPKKTAPSRPPKAPEAQETNEDEALALYRMMNGVTPLAGKSAKRLPKTHSEAPSSNLAERKAAVEAPVRAQEEEVHAHLRALVEGGRFEVTDDGRRVEGRRHGITPDVARRLRRGMFPIDARLDLHGESAGNAAKSLALFLKTQRSRGERCVLVIHGKGEHSHGGVGILRGEMAAWLSQGPASPHVAAFATASEHDGGEGAVYVLLTRM